MVNLDMRILVTNGILDKRIGVDGLFLETHPDCANAKSDGANMLPLDQLRGLMEKLVRIRAAIQ